MEYVSEQAAVSKEQFRKYGLTGRSSERDRAQIRELLGFHAATIEDCEQLTDWLKTQVVPREAKREHILEAALEWLKRNSMEPPSSSQLDRIIGSAVSGFEEQFYAETLEAIPESWQSLMDDLLKASDDSESDREPTPFAELRLDPGRPSLDSVLTEIEKLKRIVAIGLPENLFSSIPTSVIQTYRLRAATEPPRELRRHPTRIRYTLVAAFCWQRKKEIVDGLVELLIQVVHRIGVRSERKVVKTLMEDLKRVHGKTAILFRIAEAAVDNPEGTIKDVVYPVAGEQTLRDLVREYKATGSAYRQEVHETIRTSYGNHYRRMLPAILDVLEFRSNNVLHRPVMDAIELIKQHRDSKQRHFAVDEGMPIDGVVKLKFREFVIEHDANENERVNRINYEVAVLQALRERLRCKEIWVVGADRYRNPDEDLPADFDANRQEYYAAIKHPEQAVEFVAGLKQQMHESLLTFNDTILRNDKVKLLERRKNKICLTPTESQPEPTNLSYLKTEVAHRWPMTSLLDVLKETDLRVGFTDELSNDSERTADLVQRRYAGQFFGYAIFAFGLSKIGRSPAEPNGNDEQQGQK